MSLFETSLAPKNVQTSYARELNLVRRRAALAAAAVEETRRSPIKSTFPGAAHLGSLASLASQLVY